MTLEEAEDIVIPFGKHKGETIADIAEQDNGRDYLEWLVDQDWLFDDVREAISTYLDEA